MCPRKPGAPAGPSPTHPELQARHPPSRTLPQTAISRSPRPGQCRSPTGSQRQRLRPSWFAEALSTCRCLTRKRTRTWSCPGDGGCGLINHGVHLGNDRKLSNEPGPPQSARDHPSHGQPRGGAPAGNRPPPAGPARRASPPRPCSRLAIDPPCQRMPSTILTGGPLCHVRWQRGVRLPLHSCAQSAFERRHYLGWAAGPPR